MACGFVMNLKTGETFDFGGIAFGILCNIALGILACS